MLPSPRSQLTEDGLCRVESTQWRKLSGEFKAKAAAIYPQALALTVSDSSFDGNIAAEVGSALQVFNGTAEVSDTHNPVAI